MVLFYDDDRYAPKAPLTGWRKYLRRLIKVVVIFAVLLAVTMWVLSTAGGNSKALKLGIQDYLTDATGYLADLRTLDSMEFFPVTHIEFADLTLHRPLMKAKTAGQVADEEERRRQNNEVPQLKGISDYYDPGETVARIGSANVRMNFWDMFFSRRRFYALDIKDVMIEDGIWLPRRLHLQTLKVDQDNDFPAIVAQGRYGDHELVIRVRTKKAARGVYEIPDVTQFHLQIGSLQAEGVIDTGGNKSRIEFSDLRVGEHVFTGHVTMKDGFSGLGVTAVLEAGHSALTAELVFANAGVDGTVTATTLDLHDVKDMWAAYGELRALWGAPVNDRVSFGTIKADIRLNAEKLVRGEAQTPWGHAKADLVVQPYLWQLNNINGLVDGGALKGDFSIDATGTGDAQLKADMNLRGWDYARGDQGGKADVTGQADIYLRLQGAGKNFAALAQDIKGEMAVVGAAGALTQDTALYGGDKIISAMLPGLARDQALHVNCLLADFDVSGMKATAQSLLMDLPDLMVTGVGTIQLDDLSLDMKLKPSLKKEGRISRAASVQVRYAGDVAKVVAGAVVTARKDAVTGGIVPEFSAFNVGDLGIQESHPCHAYLKKP